MGSSFIYGVLVYLWGLSLLMESYSNTFFVSKTDVDACCSTGELRVPVNLPATVKDLTEDEQEFTRQSSILKAASSMLQVIIITR